MLQKFSRSKPISFVFITLLGLALLSSLWSYGSTPYSVVYRVLHFIILSGITVCLSSLLLLKNKNTLHLNFTIVSLIICLGYVLLNGYFLNGLNILHSYLTGFVLLVTGIFIALFYLNNLLKHFTVLISLVACFESFFCLLQSLRIVKSQNELFTVTGTLGNPNISAMFLAMAMPLVCSMLFYANPVIKQLTRINLAGIIIALLLLNCRTAILVTVLTSLLIFNYRFNIVQKIKCSTFSGKILIAIFTMVLIGIGGLKLYTHKKASADGRLLIYRLGVEMMTDRPLTGIGYGSFEHDYNLYQAAFVNRHPTESGNNTHIRYVLTAYNEFLQNAIEGGLIGLILFTIPFILAIFTSPFKNVLSFKYNSKDQIASNLKNEDFARLDLSIVTFGSGVLSFFLMSLINFTLQAIPVLILLSFYFAALSYASSVRQINRTPRELRSSFLKLQPALILVISVTASCILMYSAVQAWRNNALNQKAHNLIKVKKAEDALALLASLEHEITNNELYWSNRGSAFLLAKNYSKALVCFTKAKAISSKPELFYKSAFCFRMVGNTGEAVRNYTMCIALDPSKIKPQYVLMNFYDGVGNSDKAVILAKQILSYTSDNENSIVNEYRIGAKNIIKKYSIESSVNQYRTLIHL